LSKPVRVSVLRARVASRFTAGVELVLRRQDDRRQGKTARGLLRRCVEKMSGLSRAQLTRLIHRSMHRPCAQADSEVDQRGRARRRYKRYQTPLETLLALENPAQ